MAIDRRDDAFVCMVDGVERIVCDVNGDSDYFIVIDRGDAKYVTVSLSEVLTGIEEPVCSCSQGHCAHLQAVAQHLDDQREPPESVWGW